jgi:hypothetical protein
MNEELVRRLLEANARLDEIRELLAKNQYSPSGKSIFSITRSNTPEMNLLGVAKP